MLMGRWRSPKLLLEVSIYECGGPGRLVSVGSNVVQVSQQSWTNGGICLLSPLCEANIVRFELPILTLISSCGLLQDEERFLGFNTQLFVQIGRASCRERV